MCTDFLVVASDSSPVNGRSMEFGIDLRSQLLVRAPGETFRSPSPESPKDGLTWTAKYGYVGLTVQGSQLHVLADGMNTQGLSTGALWMPDSRYPAVTDHAKALILADFVGWVLGNFATVAEVKEALTSGTVEVWEYDWLAKYVPLHFPIHDAKGNSIVVEFLEGQLYIHDNPVAVLTNHPAFPVQLSNLRNYTRLSPFDTKTVTLGSEDFSMHGHGNGLFGLPGDSTPPSRFVRTTFLKQFAQPPHDAKEATALAFHLLNAVDIPLGTSRSQPSNTGKVESDYTQWVVVKDLANTIFHMRFYDNPLVYSVDLKTLDFRAAAGKTFPVYEPSAPTSIDITGKLTS